MNEEQQMATRSHLLTVGINSAAATPSWDWVVYLVALVNLIHEPGWPQSVQYPTPPDHPTFRPGRGDRALVRDGVVLALSPQNALSMDMEGTEVVQLSDHAGARIAAAKAAVVAFADGAAAMITGPVPLAEQLGWVKKESAARASIAGTATEAQTAMLTVEATLTGETVAALAATIVARADLYSAAVALISGHRRATIAVIDALGAEPTQVALDAALAAAKTQGEAALAALLAP